MKKRKKGKEKNIKEKGERIMWKNVEKTEECGEFERRKGKKVKRKT